MNALTSSSTIGSSYRFAGWSAIVSGTTGIIGFGFLVAALVGRGAGAGGEHLIRSHDAAVVLQSIFMIPVVFALRNLIGQPSSSTSRAIAVVGVTALLLVVLFLLLIFANLMWDALYMIPQGVFGVWLIVANRWLSSVLPRGLTRLGAVAGVGLVLVGTFPIGYSIFVDPNGLHGPIPFDSASPPPTMADTILHVVLLIGTLMGVATYPLWATLLGRRLRRTPDLLSSGHGPSSEASR